MSGHTPGPWKLDPVTGEISGAESAHVATFGDTYPHDSAPKPEDMMLILTAPELLQAFEGLLEEFSKPFPVINFADARAAIARAKGEK